MKSLNQSDGLWTSLSAKEVDTADYQAACCLRARVDAASKTQAQHHEIRIDDEPVSEEWLKSLIDKAKDSHHTGHTDSKAQDHKAKP